MIKFLLIFFVSSSVLFCDYIKWQNDYEKALILAKEQKKGVLLLILKGNSENQKAPLTNFFSKEEVVKVVNEKYIPVVAFFEGNNSYPVELFYAQLFPALFFVSSKDESFLYKPIFGDFDSNSVK